MALSGSSDAPRVSVVIPARNASACLGACLAALQPLGVPGAAAELIVVDDGSEDDTAKIATAAGAQVLQTHGRGPAAARNAGAQAACGQVLIFLDADTAPLAGWLEALLAPFDDPQVVAVKGRYLSRQRGIVPRYAQLEFEEKYARLERAARVDFVDTGTAAYRRDVFVSAGGFDESFPAQSAEDVELAFRLAGAGARFAFSSRARVWHTHANSLREYLYKKARYGFFRVTVYRRYPSKLKGDSYTPPWMGVQIVLAGSLSLSGLATLLGWPRWVTGGLLGLFSVTCWPLLRRTLHTDPRLLPWVVPLSFLRAFAQGVGLFSGLVAVTWRRRRPR